MQLQGNVILEICEVITSHLDITALYSAACLVLSGFKYRSSCHLVHIAG